MCESHGADILRVSFFVPGLMWRHFDLFLALRIELGFFSPKVEGSAYVFLFRNSIVVNRIFAFGDIFSGGGTGCVYA